MKTTNKPKEFTPRFLCSYTISYKTINRDGKTIHRNITVLHKLFQEAMKEVLILASKPKVFDLEVKGTEIINLTQGILDFFTENNLPIDEPYIIDANPAKTYNLPDLVNQTIIPELYKHKYMAIYINPDDLDIQFIPSTSHENLLSENDFTEEDLQYLQTFNIGDLTIDFAIY